MVVFLDSYLICPLPCYQGDLSKARYDLITTQGQAEQLGEKVRDVSYWRNSKKDYRGKTLSVWDSTSLTVVRVNEQYSSVVPLAAEVQWSLLVVIVNNGQPS